MPRNSKPVPTENPVTLRLRAGKEGRKGERESNEEPLEPRVCSFSLSLSVRVHVYQVRAREKERLRVIRVSCGVHRRIPHA